MKFLTSLAADIELGYQSENVPLGECLSRRYKFQSLFKEKNTFLVLVCFEEGDAWPDIKEGSLRISNQYINMKHEAHTISIIPFAHLTPQALADEHQVNLLFDKLQRTLTNKGHKVRWLRPSAGNVFASKWVFFDKLHSVKYGSTEACIQNTLRSLLRAYGSRKIFAVLGDLLNVECKIKDMQKGE